MCARLLAVTWKKCVFVYDFFSALVMLTYLVASFWRFLHIHPPLVVQLHGHTAATIGVLLHPAEKLLKLPPQGGVGVTVGL